MADVALSLGCNIGDREGLLARMRGMVDDLLCSALRASPVMESAPLGVGADHGWYLNQVVAGPYQGSARQLLESCRQIEIALGRTGKGLKEPRTADIDILLYGDEVVREDGLEIPHRELLARRFCLVGLTAVAPAAKHPVVGLSFAELLARMAPEVAEQTLVVRT